MSESAGSGRRSRWLPALGRVLRWPPTLLAMPIMLLSWSLADHEDALYRVFAESVTVEHATPRAKVEALMRAAHVQVTQRAEAWPPERRAELQQTSRYHLLGSGDAQWLQATGACGSYAAMFVQACHEVGIEARLLQMRVEGETKHIATEARLPGGWAFVDPMYEQVFEGEDGRLLGFAEVAAAWPALRTQADPAYERNGFHFRAARYTNWGRLPVVLPAFRRLLSAWKGEAYAATFSLRSHLLNGHRVRAYGALFVLVLLLIGRALVGAVRRRRRRRAVA